jgi:uncharacterized protein YecA (UPF0149 family)
MNELKAYAEEKGINNHKYQEILKTLDILLEDLNEDQKIKLLQFSKTIKDPAEMSTKDALNLINTLGIDLDNLQKKARKKRVEELEKNRKPKIGANEQCPCNSGKKYKKCCRFKNE